MNHKILWVAPLMALVGCTGDQVGAREDGLFASIGVASPSASASSASSPSTPSSSATTTTSTVTTGVLAPRDPRPNTTVWRQCDAHRLVGSLRYGTRCPAPSGNWRADGRFAGLVNESGAGYCGYTLPAHLPFTFSGLPVHRSQDDVNGWVLRPEQWLEPDCPTVVPLSDDDAIASWGPAHVEAQRRQLDHLVSLPTVRPFFGQSLPQTTDVWILDASRNSSAADIEPLRGVHSDHGFAVGLLMRDLLCPEGREGVCPVRFKSRNVLGRGYDGGGAHGYIGDLAVAIRHAVDQNAQVIVLAVGFHEQFARQGDHNFDVNRFHEAADTIRAALNYARCRNVAVVAAAGNTEAGPLASVVDGRNPMYPAGFSDERGWSCGSTSPPANARLVLTASALDPWDAPAPNARANGEAELAAPGFAVVAPNPLGAGPSFVSGGTGSSFAAAHLAALVALVKAYQPGATPEAIHARIAQHGVRLGRDASFCHQTGRWPSCAEVRRIDVCRTVRSIVEPLCRPRSGGLLFIPPAECSALPVCDPLAAGAGAPAQGVDFARLAQATTESAADPSQIGVLGQCGASGAAVVGWPSSEPGSSLCPALEHENGIRTPNRVGSLPGVDPCGACVIDARDPARPELVVSLQPGLSIGSPVLDIGTSSVALGSFALQSQSSVTPLRIALPPMQVVPTHAKLSVMVGESQSATGYVPVYVGP